MQEIDVNENEIDFKKLTACLFELKPHYASIIEMRFLMNSPSMKLVKF